MGRKLRVWMLAVAVMATCLLASAGPAAAIQFGQPDGDAHPYVAWSCSTTRTMSRVEDDGRATPPPARPDRRDGPSDVGARVWSEHHPRKRAGRLSRRGAGLYDGTPYTNPDYREIPLLAARLRRRRRRHRRPGQARVRGPVWTLPTAGAVGGASSEAASRHRRVRRQLPRAGRWPRPDDQWQWYRARYYAPTQLVETRSKLSSEFMKLALQPGPGDGGGTFGDSGGRALLRHRPILGITALGTSLHGRRR